MNARIHLRGPLRYRLRCAADLGRCVLEVSVRRALKGPRLPDWNWFVELATQILKRQTLAAFRMSDVNEARRYLDSVVISSPALSEVSITPVVQEKFQWKLVCQQELRAARKRPVFSRWRILVLSAGLCQLYRVDYAGCEIQNVCSRLSAVAGTSIPGAT